MPCCRAPMAGCPTRGCGVTAGSGRHPSTFTRQRSVERTVDREMGGYWLEKRKGFLNSRCCSVDLPAFNRCPESWVKVNERGILTEFLCRCCIKKLCQTPTRTAALHVAPLTDSQSCRLAQAFLFFEKRPQNRLDQPFHFLDPSKNHTLATSPPPVSNRCCFQLTTYTTTPWQGVYSQDPSSWN